MKRGYRCKLCGALVKGDLKSKNLHILKMHPECGAKFLDYARIRIFMPVDIDDKSKIESLSPTEINDSQGHVKDLATVQCTICGKVFPKWQSSIIKHFKKFHRSSFKELNTSHTFDKYLLDVKSANGISESSFKNEQASHATKKQKKQKRKLKSLLKKEKKAQEKVKTERYNAYKESLNKAGITIVSTSDEKSEEPLDKSLIQTLIAGHRGKRIKSPLRCCCCGKMKSGGWTYKIEENDCLLLCNRCKEKIRPNNGYNPFSSGLLIYTPMGNKR